MSYVLQLVLSQVLRLSLETIVSTMCEWPAGMNLFLSGLFNFFLINSFEKVCIDFVIF